MFDRTGAAIEAACNFRGPGRLPIVQALHAGHLDKIEEVSDEQFIYVGATFPHYGHFITTTISRFWYVQRADNRHKLKLLYHDTVDPIRLFARSHVAQIFGALDLGPDNFVQFQRPTLIRGILDIPHPSFEENHFAHEAFVVCARTIGERIIGRPCSKTDVPLYLSKAKLEQGLRGFVNEAEIEEELCAHGVRVVYPERLAFDEQLRVLTRHSRILGSVGSAFHTTAFLPKGRRIVGLNQTELLNSNYLILDAVCDNNATYVHPLEVEVDSATSRFRRSLRLRNPRAVAREMLELL